PAAKARDDGGNAGHDLVGAGDRLRLPQSRAARDRPGGDDRDRTIGTEFERRPGPDPYGDGAGRSRTVRLAGAVERRERREDEVGSLRRPASRPGSSLELGEHAVGRVKGNESESPALALSVGSAWLEHATSAMSTSRMESTAVRTCGICSTNVYARPPASGGLVRQLVRQTRSVRNPCARTWVSSSAPAVGSATRKRAAGVCPPADSLEATV